MGWTPITKLNGAVPDNHPVISRPRDGAVLAGVCSGLARQWHVDPNLVRIAMAILTFFGGLGIALYLSGVLLLPRDGQTHGPLARAIPAVRTWPKGLLVALVVVACVAITWGSGGGSALVPALIVGAVLWFGVFKRRGVDTGTATPALEPTPFERAADAWRVRLGEHQVPGFERATSQPAAPRLPATDPDQYWQQPYTDPDDRLVSDAPAPVPAVRPKRRWGLWSLAFVLAGAGTGAVALFGLAGFPATPLAYLSAVLAALGITAVVASRFGRPPLLIPVIIITAVALLTQLTPGHGFGAIERVIAEPAQLPAAIEMGAGDVNLDLSRLSLNEDRQLAIKVGVGDVRVKLPATTASELTWNVRVGESRIDGESHSGVGLGGGAIFGGAQSDPTLTMTIEVAVGDLEVTR